MTEFPLSDDEQQRQIELLRSPPPPARLIRPCTLGDGLRALSDAQRPGLEATWRQAAAAGRFSKFVPASGAASRMFSVLDALQGDAPPAAAELERRRDAGDATARDLLELLERVEDLPFSADLAASAPGEPPPAVVAGDRNASRLSMLALMRDLGYAARPKGLIPFHRYPDGARTALEEQLVEGAAYVLDRAGHGRIHFTVAAAHLDAFAAAATCQLADSFEISFSTQHPGTDTLSLEADGIPGRTADGALLLRPGGHGALLRNLQDWGGDLVYIKNIDNILPESRQTQVVIWQRLLGGLLVEVERRVNALIEGLAATDPVALQGVLADATDFCLHQFGHRVTASDAEGRRAELHGLLDRPLRICGMVPSTGEPGGGPFWVGDSGASGSDTRRPQSDTGRPQIVESAQVDLEDDRQRSIWEASTHFNPVMLVAAVRRFDGSSHQLADFVDRRAVFVNQKPFEGRTLRVLEHPGLWNGAMANWNTVFVEVPLATFAPVKTVLDLLRPAHQGG